MFKQGVSRLSTSVLAKMPIVRISRRSLSPILGSTLESTSKFPTKDINSTTSQNSDLNSIYESYLQTCDNHLETIHKFNAARMRKLFPSVYSDEFITAVMDADAHVNMMKEFQPLICNDNLIKYINKRAILSGCVNKHKELAKIARKEKGIKYDIYLMMVIAWSGLIIANK